MPDQSVRLRIKNYGIGRPVVLIHGWPLSSAAFEAQFPALQAAGHRVVSYDRRGFGQSAKPESGYDYDTLAADLDRVMTELDLREVTLLGFSMGGGEVARYISNFGEDRLESVIFASAVPPYLMKTDDNPDGPLTPDKAEAMEDELKRDRNAFFDRFTSDFFSADGELKVSEKERRKAIELCQLSDQAAALDCMDAFGTTDFRKDLENISVPTLVLHGDADGVVPYEGSGERTSGCVRNASAVVLSGAPHGCNVSHSIEFNRAVIDFLR